MTKKEKKLRVKQPKPRQADLPGMADRRIPDLHKAAEEYAEVRDERMALTKQEVDLQEVLLEKMKLHKMDRYKFEDVECILIHEKEKVKVKRRKDDPVE